MRENRLQLRTPFAQIHNFIGAAINKGKVAPQPAWLNNPQLSADNHDAVSYSMSQADSLSENISHNNNVNNLTSSFANTTIGLSGTDGASYNPFGGVQVQQTCNPTPTPQNISSHQSEAIPILAQPANSSISVPVFAQPTIVAVPQGRPIYQTRTVSYFGPNGAGVSVPQLQQQAVRSHLGQPQNIPPALPPNFHPQGLQQSVQANFSSMQNQQHAGQTQKRSNMSMFDPLA